MRGFVRWCRRKRKPVRLLLVNSGEFHQTVDTSLPGIYRILNRTDRYYHAVPRYAIRWKRVIKLNIEFFPPCIPSGIRSIYAAGLNARHTPGMSSSSFKNQI